MSSFLEGFHPFISNRCRYIYIRYKKLRRHRGLRHSRDRLLHAFPARIAKFSPQSPFRPLPVRLSFCHLSFACLRETEQPLPPVLSAPHANPALPPQQPQRPRQRRTIHGKARAQPFLIGLFSRSQRGKQAELRDFESCLPQLLVIDPRYDSSDASQVLTRAGQVKQCCCRLLFTRLWSHSICIYILCSFCQAKIALLHWSETPEEHTLHDSQFVSSMIPGGWSGNPEVTILLVLTSGSKLTCFSARGRYSSRVLIVFEKRKAGAVLRSFRWDRHFPPARFIFFRPTINNEALAQHSRNRR